jgi:hypothetical protein
MEYFEHECQVVQWDENTFLLTGGHIAYHGTRSGLSGLSLASSLTEALASSASSASSDEDGDDQDLELMRYLS